jgi:hypothetical protein
MLQINQVAEPALYLCSGTFYVQSWHPVWAHAKKFASLLVAPLASRDNARSQSQNLLQPWWPLGQCLLTSQAACLTADLWKGKSHLLLAWFCTDRPRSQCSCMYRVSWLALTEIASFSLLMLEGQRYSLFCHGIKSLPLTFRNGWTDGRTTIILYNYNYDIIIILHKRECGTSITLVYYSVYVEILWVIITHTGTQDIVNAWLSYTNIWGNL